MSFDQTEEGIFKITIWMFPQPASVWNTPKPVDNYPL